MERPTVNFLNKVNDYEFDLPLVIDVEEHLNTGSPHSITKRRLIILESL